ncbi:IS3 family transposase, partial [Candidatus Parcubacteria bacterium]
MKYQFIKQYRRCYPVGKMCQVLGVARSGYYRWLHRQPGRWERENMLIIEEIKQLYSHRHYRCYGSPRITALLRAKGYHCSRPRVARLMRANGLRSSIKPRYRVTTNSKHEEKVSPNLLNQDFNVSAANRVWVSDITYIWTAQGWTYLTIVMDLYNREIIGWSLSKSLESRSTSIKALLRALQKRGARNGLIFHSDRGVQYSCGDFRELLKRHCIRQSMSGKGNCYDNAVAESFFHTLKTEHVHQQNYQTR